MHNHASNPPTTSTKPQYPAECHALTCIGGVFTCPRCKYAHQDPSVIQVRDPFLFPSAHSSCLYQAHTNSCVSAKAATTPQGPVTHPSSKVMEDHNVCLSSSSHAHPLTGNLPARPIPFHRWYPRFKTCLHTPASLKSRPAGRVGSAR